MHYFNETRERPFKIFLFIFFLFSIILPIFIMCFFAFASNDKLLWHPGKRLTLGAYLLYSHLWLTFVFCLVGCMILMFVKLKSWMRASLLVLVFIAFAIIPAYSGLSCTLRMPSPLCVVIRPLLIIKSGNPNFPIKFSATILSIVILSVLGNKLFCSWVCPIGALQELLNLIPFPIKRIKIPFIRMNLVRVLLFIAFFPTFFILGRIIYFNPFAPMRWGITADPWMIYSLVFLGIVLAASFLLYRPYCYFICPIGLITWLLEHISRLKIRYYKERCNSCKTCVLQTNCPTVAPILEEKRILPDCHSCGKCIEVCPNDALKFRFR